MFLGLHPPGTLGWYISLETADSRPSGKVGEELGSLGRLWGFCLLQPAARKRARSHSVLAKISTWFSRNSSASAELGDFNKVLPEKVWAAVITISKIGSLYNTLLGCVSPCGGNSWSVLAMKRGGQLISMGLSDSWSIYSIHIFLLPSSCPAVREISPKCIQLCLRCLKVCTLSWKKLTS